MKQKHLHRIRSAIVLTLAASATLLLGLTLVALRNSVSRARVVEASRHLCKAIRKRDQEASTSAIAASHMYVQAFDDWVSTAAGENGTAAGAGRSAQHRHHTYYATEADPYSCDFSVLPGAWTGSATAQGSGPPQPAADDTTAAGSGDGGASPTGSSASGALYGTVAAQATIWAHQHPPDCRKQRFLLHTPQVSAASVWRAVACPADAVCAAAADHLFESFACCLKLCRQ